MKHVLTGSILTASLTWTGDNVRLYENHAKRVFMQQLNEIP